MGEIADMMLDGTLCECCGSFIDFDDGDGFPRYCSDQCARDRGADFNASEIGFSIAPTHKVDCPICKKRVKSIGLDHHIQAKHGDAK